MNTRTHFRNSTLAFPNTAEYGCSIERPRPRLSWVRISLVIMMIASLLYLWPIK